MKLFLLLSTLFISTFLLGQSIPPSIDNRLYDIADASSPDRIEIDIRKLVSFGTRNTLSDTISNTRGIGAARRWIKSEFKRISETCSGCLQVYYQDTLIPAEGNRRIPQDVKVVNVIAHQKGTKYPNRYIIMSGDIDSRASNSSDGETDAPGANDNATGMAGVIEAARILSKYQFENSIIYVGLSGEEQGLYGGRKMASQAKQDSWDIVGILNNDMIGNITGIDGVVENNTFRIFSEPTPVTDDQQKQIWRRFYGGEVDGPSRQLARYIARITNTYLTNLEPILIYRLDRFGRGGHHRPFNDAGFPGVRIMETHENYVRQHQDIREENGIQYGDVIEGVNFDYAAKLTAVNALALASLAWAPPGPSNLMIGGAVQPSTTLQWDESDDDHIAGYKIYWRETTAPQWNHSRYVGKVNQYTLKGIIIDNYLFGVAAVSKKGHESPVVYPNSLIPRRR